jgi:hypothetical protein
MVEYRVMNAAERVALRTSRDFEGGSAIFDRIERGNGGRSPSGILINRSPREGKVSL